MTDWRGDLLKIGIIPDDMPDQTNFVLFNLDELNDFIKDVAEKAIDEGVFYGLDKIEEVREEAREEGRFTEDEKYHLVNLLGGGIQITDSITQSEIFKSILSKLKDNK